MARNTYVILSEKNWHNNFANDLNLIFKSDNFVQITNEKDFNFEVLKELNPQKIFIPHWSYIISSSIYNEFECVVFHMTDLPYGRGGSPLQNLIVRGHKKTKISALKVEKGLDTGDVYLKKELNLEGSAQKIFDRSTSIVLLMIKEIVEKNMTPVKQTGEATLFKRRTPEMSNIEDVESLNKLYDYIRMLDADGYPKAYLENSSFRFEFSQSELKNDSIEGHVRIIKK